MKSVVFVLIAIIGLSPVFVFADGKISDTLVTRVIDGDTIQIETGEKVRLIGIDAPEIHYGSKMVAQARRSRKDVQTIKRLGALSKEFTRGLVENKRVRLEFDVEKHDRYGRLLAYVYLKDGTFVNAEIITAGYAQILTLPPNVKHSDLFLKLQRQARQEKRGLWGQ